MTLIHSSPESISLDRRAVGNHSYWSLPNIYDPVSAGCLIGTVQPHFACGLRLGAEHGTTPMSENLLAQACLSFASTLRWDLKFEGNLIMYTRKISKFISYYFSI
ncbi:unnamed protein product [Somion occarium]|uniref:Uncharacterized protein n=1 Tax=Somion occarium TaxID=3059160 RepID=A0ABP1EAI4_9APHY